MELILQRQEVLETIRSVTAILPATLSKDDSGRAHYYRAKKELRSALSALGQSPKPLHCHPGSESENEVRKLIEEEPGYNEEWEEDQLYDQEQNDEEDNSDDAAAGQKRKRKGEAKGKGKKQGKTDAAKDPAEKAEQLAHRLANTHKVKDGLRATAKDIISFIDPQPPAPGALRMKLAMLEERSLGIGLRGVEYISQDDWRLLFNIPAGASHNDMSIETKAREIHRNLMIYERKQRVVANDITLGVLHEQTIYSRFLHNILDLCAGISYAADIRTLKNNTSKGKKHKLVNSLKEKAFQSSPVVATRFENITAPEKRSLMEQEEIAELFAVWKKADGQRATARNDALMVYEKIGFSIFFNPFFSLHGLEAGHRSSSFKHLLIEIINNPPPARRRNGKLTRETTGNGDDKRLVSSVELASKSTRSSLINLLAILSPEARNTVQAFMQNHLPSFTPATEDDYEDEDEDFMDEEPLDDDM